MFKKLSLFSISLLLLSGCSSSVHPTKKVKPIKSTKTVKVTKPVKVSVEKKSLQTKKSLKKDKHAMHVMFQTVLKKDAILVQKGAAKESCAMCGMNLIKFYKTSYKAKVDGKNVQYCSLHCMADAVKHGAELENPMVVDVKSLKFIPVMEAYYVVGSSVSGTMSRVSKYAFKSLHDAKLFQRKYGGKIVDFQTAWNIAKKDFSK